MSRSIKAKRHPGTVKRARQTVAQFRSRRLLDARGMLLKCLLRDARVERCVQLVL